MEEEIEVDYSPDDEEEAPGTQTGPDVAEDIYSDLYDAQGEKGALLKARYAALQEQSRGQELMIDKLRGRIEELTEDNTALSDERKILIRNISCIYRTAKEEVLRKDEEIKNLRMGNGKSLEHPRSQGNFVSQPGAVFKEARLPSPNSPPLHFGSPPPPPVAPPPM